MEKRVCDIETKAGYDRWAPLYDHDLNPLTALEIPEFLKNLNTLEGTEICLDLGAGTGRHLLPLSHRTEKVVALDFSQGMLEEAKKKTLGHTNIEFIEHDLTEALPFETATFDFVCSSLVLEHLPSLPFFFQEASRVLVPDGRAYFSAMHPAMMLKGSQAAFTDPDTQEKVRPKSYDHSISDMVNALIGAGFRITRMAEFKVTPELTKDFPRAEKYLGWPMLVTFQVG